MSLRPEENPGTPNVPAPRRAAWQKLVAPIIFDGTASPIKKALFLIICAAWIFPGLIGHDPWKPDEAVPFGVIYSMLSEGHWVMPMVAGEANLDYPPLYHWLAALTATLFGWLLPLHDAARIATGVCMAVTMLYVHKTATRLFDERAGRIAVLLLIGCLGLWRGHQMSPEVAGLTGMAIAIYGMTRIRTEPRKGGVTTGIGAAIIGLAVGIVPALVVPLISVALMVFVGDHRNRDFRRGVLISLMVMLPLMAAYPLAICLSTAAPLDARLWTDVVLGAPFLDASTRGSIQPLYFTRILAWYALPALPFALWLWWRDRAKLRERFELALPLVAFVVTLLYFSFTREAREASAFAMLVPLALAAAMALDRLPRDVATIMDWFGLVFFGVVAVALWFYWAAAQTGVPAAAARGVARQVGDFQFSFSALPFVLALALTLVWLFAVIRAHRNNRRAIVNWAAGFTLVWMLANLLGQPALDHRLSHRAVATAVAAQLAPTRRCVAEFGLGESERAAFDYVANVRFFAQSDVRSANCDWLLTFGDRERAPVVDAAWQKTWQGGRFHDREELFRLYRR